MPHDEDLQAAIDRRVAAAERITQLEGRVTMLEASNQRMETHTGNIYRKLEAWEETARTEAAARTDKELAAEQEKGRQQRALTLWAVSLLVTLLGVGSVIFFKILDLSAKMPPVVGLGG